MRFNVGEKVWSTRRDRHGEVVAVLEHEPEGAVTIVRFNECNRYSYDPYSLRAVNNGALQPEQKSDGWVA